jgi:hypothetical protein
MKTLIDPRHSWCAGIRGVSLRHGRPDHEGPKAQKAFSEMYEFVAIGSGPAGESAAELAAFFGHRSAVIEKARPGGTVTTTGGVPTKTLREAAVYPRPDV